MASMPLAGPRAAGRRVTPPLVEASAIIAFMSTFGADVIDFHPLACLADDDSPPVARGGVGGTCGADSGSSIKNISSSGMPVATGRAENVGRSIGLLGTDDCLFPRLLGPGGESFGESLKAPERAVGTMGCGKSCSASHAPHFFIGLQTRRGEHETGYLRARSARK